MTIGLLKKDSLVFFSCFVCCLLYLRRLLESFILSNDYGAQSRLSNRWTAESKKREFKKTKKINKMQIRNLEYFDVASLLLVLPNKNITKFSPKNKLKLNFCFLKFVFYCPTNFYNSDTHI